ncbi:hypothetical protein H5410_032218 [Solanum commersonii]|uniref:NADP-dependent oxidoreductase domain-containing protein n=1 Tax=Solanum commersonii TaxID=4109 RepID=A0A9J5YMB5_SOLCO|nr:hypothetical protein H5410_032218 [Solanum commersonii]
MASCSTFTPGIPSCRNFMRTFRPSSPSWRKSRVVTAKLAQKNAMQYRKLGDSDLNISEITIGTMTFGEQNTEKEAHEILSYAFDQGINIIDTAEAVSYSTLTWEEIVLDFTILIIEAYIFVFISSLPLYSKYPVPMRKETQGTTDLYISSWMKSQPRDKVILATKVCGYSERSSYMRENAKVLRVDAANIRESVEKSLKRLNTDYIDLLQIHWGRAARSDRIVMKSKPGAIIELLTNWEQSSKYRIVLKSNHSTRKEPQTPWNSLEDCRILWNEFKVNTIVKVADGVKTVFWKDDWHEAGNMETLFLDIYNLILHQQSTIAELWTPQGWNFVHFNDWEIPRVTKFFSTIDQFSGLKAGQDILQWQGNSNGTFKVNAAYRKMNQPNQQILQWPWKHIWKAKIPHKVACFVWPDRYVPLFGEFFYETSKWRPSVPFVEQLRAFQELINEGKDYGGNSEHFLVIMGLYHGSVLSPSLFALAMDVLRRHIQEEAAWCMLWMI